MITTTITTMRDAALLRLLWLSSPALPIGAYAYSRGLELAVEAGWVTDADTAADWIGGVLARSVATLDAPVLARLFDAFLDDDPTRVAHWDDFLCAARETREALLEDLQLGLSLRKVLREASVPEPVRPPRSYAAAFARACAHFGIGRDEALLGYLFAFVEGQVTAAIKLVPLGQTSGQAVLARLMARVPTVAAEAGRLCDDELGSHAPGLALASALHETQYTRLFRS